MKKIIHLLTLWDGLWAVPLAFISFLAFEAFGRALFGQGFGAYDPAVFQAALMAAVIMVFANLLVQLALKFNFPTLWHVYHDSFINLFQELVSWQKISLTVCMYCFFFVLFIVVFLKVV